MSRDALEGLEGSDLDLEVALAWLVREAVPFDEDELHAARRSDDFDFPRRLGRRPEAGPRQLLWRVGPLP